MFWSGLVLGIAVTGVLAYVWWTLKAVTAYNAGYAEGQIDGTEMGQAMHNHGEFDRGYALGVKDANAEHHAKRVEAGRKASATRKLRDTLIGDSDAVNA
jgi:hypothetical protein